MVFLVFLMAWPSAGWIASLMPGTGSFLVALVVTLLLVYSLKKAFIEPFLMAALMQVYFQCIEGQVPNPAWVEKLSGLSEKFRSMTDKFTNTPPQVAQPQAYASSQAQAPAQWQAQQAQAHPSQWQAQQQAQAQPSQWQAQQQVQAQPSQWQAQEQAHPSQWQAQQQPQAQPSQWQAQHPPQWQAQIAPTLPTQPMTKQHGGASTLPLGLVNPK
jgi:hypothetical protein